MNTKIMTNKEVANIFLHLNEFGNVCECDIRMLIQSHDRLKSDLQALRERLKEVEWASSFDPGLRIIVSRFCPACKAMHKVEDHLQGCWLKAELDKLKGDE